MRPRPLVLAAALAASALALVAGPAVGAAAPVSSASLAFGPNTVAYPNDYGEPGLDIAPDGTVYATTPGDGGAVLARSSDKG